MSYNSFTDMEIANLTTHKWPSLTSLHMSKSDNIEGGDVLCDQGINYLLKGNWSKRKKLFLSSSNITDEASSRSVRSTGPTSSTSK